ASGGGLRRRSGPCPRTQAQAAAFDSFPASLDRVKGVQARGSLSGSSDGTKEGGPGPRVEVARTRPWCKAEVTGEALDRQRRRNRAEPATEPRLHELRIPADFADRDKRLVTSHGPEDAGVDRRRRGEHVAR